MHAATAEGVLLLGILRQDEWPVAAQYWIITDGVASLLKLARDEATKAISPGTLLTAMLVRRLLDDTHVAELDFGRGDDAFKAQWARQRRQRIGVVLATPWRVDGGGAIVRHLLGGYSVGCVDRCRPWPAVAFCPELRRRVSSVHNGAARYL
jgi:CelD/BcsL family acetyltransferase involved in cellulose biosynthesis